MKKFEIKDWNGSKIEVEFENRKQFEDWLKKANELERKYAGIKNAYREIKTA